MLGVVTDRTFQFIVSWLINMRTPHVTLILKYYIFGFVISDLVSRFIWDLGFCWIFSVNNERKVLCTFKINVGLSVSELLPVK